MLDSLMNALARGRMQHTMWWSCSPFCFTRRLRELGTWARHMVECAGTPLKNAGRKRKVQESAE